MAIYFVQIKRRKHTFLFMYWVSKKKKRRYSENEIEMKFDFAWIRIFIFLLFFCPFSLTQTHPTQRRTHATHDSNISHTHCIYSVDQTVDFLFFLEFYTLWPKITRLLLPCNSFDPGRILRKIDKYWLIKMIFSTNFTTCLYQLKFISYFLWIFLKYFWFF